MTGLDRLAQPCRHYVEANKACSTTKEKADLVISSQQPTILIVQTEEAEETLPPSPVEGSREDGNAKRIISEDEARTEKEAKLKKQRLEEIRREEEECLHQEIEKQKRLEKETLQLLQEHQRAEEKKLRMAIIEKQCKEEEERDKREEEQRLKADKERKAQEEAKSQRIEMEEKLCKEKEERTKRKQRPEKIRSKTRGKLSNTFLSGSISGSEQLDSSVNQQDNHSSGVDFLESNLVEENNSEPTSLEYQPNKLLLANKTTSLGAHLAFSVSSENKSMVDIVMPKSGMAPQKNSLLIIPGKTSTNLFESHLPGSDSSKKGSNAENLAMDPNSLASEENKPSSAKASQLPVKAQNEENAECYYIKEKNSLISYRQDVGSPLYLACGTSPDVAVCDSLNCPQLKQSI